MSSSRSQVGLGDPRFERLLRQRALVVVVASVTITGLIVEEVWGQPRLVLAALGALAVAAVCNGALTIPLIRAWGVERTEDLRTVVMIVMWSALGHSIGWARPIWLILPVYGAMASAIPVTRAMLRVGLFLTAWNAIALSDGALPQRAVGYTLVAVIVCWLGRTRAELTQGLLDDARAATAAAEEAVRAKTQFVANVSHEVRTPVNGVLGLTELLLASPLSPEQHELARALRTSGETLLGVINQVLDFSKIESGRLEPERIPFDVDELLEETTALFTGELAKKQLTLEVSLEADLPRRLIGDPTRLKQILTNLIGNALKFTSSGGVRVHGSAERRPAGVQLRFEVRDTGIGIPKALQGRLFRAFSQVDGSTSRRYGGTGLGLAISRQLAELMGGALGVESEEGQGATFWFTAKVTEASKPATQPPAPALATATDEVRGMRVLLVEDNHVNQLVAVGLLKRLGLLSVDVANDGQEALAACDRRPYDLVLMDCQMPVCDGYEATRALRSRGFTMPIVAMTAQALDGDRKACLAAGMTEYLVKPVVLRQLGQVLERVVHRPAAQAG